MDYGYRGEDRVRLIGNVIKISTKLLVIHLRGR